MALKAFPRVQLQALTLEELMRAFGAIWETLARVIANADLDKVTLPGNVFTGAVPLVINHKLGRQPIGWRIVDVTVGYNIFQRIAWDARTITLLCPSAATANIEVW